MRLLQRLKYIDNDAWVWLKVRAMAFYDRLGARQNPSRNSQLIAGLKCYCTFIGYPRSGHSLVGSILDAHPRAAFSHRLDALKYMERGVPAGELFQMIRANARRFSTAGRRLTGYAYAIPEQWQTVNKTLAVIGDQEARCATLRLKRHPELLASFGLGHPISLKFIHVIRHPLDNISTWANRTQLSLPRMVERYFELCEGVRCIKEHFGTDCVLDIYLEDLIQRPDAEIARLCGFVGLEAPPHFADKCGRIIYKEPNCSRNTRQWSDDLVADVARRSARYEFLARYDFPAEPAT
jgi:hypothetical protein